MSLIPLLLAASAAASASALLPTPPPPPERRPRIPSMQGQMVQKRFVLASNGFNVEANGMGNAPFFMYWPDGKEDKKMKVMFEKMWQVDSLDRKLRPIINLAGMYDWTFTDVTSNELNEGQIIETAFNITGIPKQQREGFPEISFLNHLVSSRNGTELKFDVEIRGFQVLILLFLTIWFFLNHTEWMIC